MNSHKLKEMTSPSQEMTYLVSFLCSLCHFEVSCTHNVYELFPFESKFAFDLETECNICMNVSKATICFNKLQCKDFTCVSLYIIYIWQAFSYFIGEKKQVSETFFILHLTKAQPEGTGSVNIDP